MRAEEAESEGSPCLLWPDQGELDEAESQQLLSSFRNSRKERASVPQIRGLNLSFFYLKLSEKGGKKLRLITLNQILFKKK